MIELAPLEERLALFAEGVAGRYFHVKPTGEFAGRRLVITDDRGTLAGDTLYLPERLAVADPAAYRVLALQQLCHREFGTQDFRLGIAAARIADVEDVQIAELGGRASDFERFYHQFSHPPLMSRLFHLCERARVDALMVATYPGIRRHLAQWQSHLARHWPAEPVVSLGTALAALEAQTQGAAPELIAALDVGDILGGAIGQLAEVARRPGDVYAAAAAAVAIYRDLARLIDSAAVELELPLDEELDDATSWSQREARLEDWRDDLAAMEASLSVEMLEGEQTEAGTAEHLADGDVRPEDLDLRKLGRERDDLARKIDMERSALRDALGAGAPLARSFRYDEWSYLERRYLPRYCRLFEQRLEPDPEADLGKLQAVIRAHRSGVQKRLEQIKPLGYQRVYRLADGDELDFNAVIQARQDARAGHTPDERVYSRRDRVHRDVCAAFLVDLSASTDDPIDPPAPLAPEDPDDPFLWGRAGVGAVSRPRSGSEEDRGLETAPTVEEDPPRRIIDVQRESMLVMSAALESLGDSYGVYGFSGYGHDCVELFVAKEPDERFGRHTLAAIAGMKPKRSTRMGPAIRHATRKLLDSGNSLRVLLIISDGFPQDCDYGPERGEHEYGVQDTAKALQEAHDKGVETFCVTVDRSGHDYLKRMCPEARYLVIEEIEDLPEQLSKVYEALTG